MGKATELAERRMARDVDRAGIVEPTYEQIEMFTKGEMASVPQVAWAGRRPRVLTRAALNRSLGATPTGGLRE